MLRALVAEEAKVLGFPICEGGTVVTIQGPRLTIVNITTGKDRNSHHRFSSKAESHMFRLWGADVVNMTTVPEVQSGCGVCTHHHPPQVVLAKEAGLSYAAIAMPTDYDCWKEGQVVDVTAVMEVTLLAWKDFIMSLGKGYFNFSNLGKVMLTSLTVITRLTFSSAKGVCLQHIKSEAVGGGCSEEDWLPELGFGHSRGPQPPY